MPATARIRRWVEVLLPTPAPRSEAGWTCGVSQRMLPRSQWRELMRDKVGAEQLQQVNHCTTQTGGSECGPEGQRSAPSGSRRAATVSVTTGECARKPWRIMTADSAIDGR
jgi:hypothetical protein